MTLFLRDDKNRSIVDIEYYIDCGDDSDKEKKWLELRPSVMIEPYSRLLLNCHENKRDEMIEDFERIDELRGWLWERHFGGRQNTAKEYKDVLELLRAYLHGIARKYNLNYVED